MKDEYSDVKKIPAGSEVYVGDVYFGYVPNGFKYEVTSEIKSSVVIDFTNNEKYFTLTITKNNWNDQVNTENSDVEEYMINNIDMLFIENEIEKSLSWKENNKVCVLSTNCEKEVLLKIAENIKINNSGPQN